MMTAIPIVKTVRMPLTFEPHVQAIKTPVTISQSHHSEVNSLSFDQRETKLNSEMDVPITQFAETDI